MGKRIVAPGYGERIRQARRYLALLLARDITQQEIADAVGVSQPTIGRWQNELPGKKPGPGVFTELATFFRVSRDWLERNEGPMVPVEEASSSETTPRMRPVTAEEKERADEEAQRKRRRRRKG